MSALKNQLKEKNEEYLKRIDAATSKIDKLINNNLHNYIKYLETNDNSYLVKETEKLKAKKLEALKENVEPNTSVLPQKKTTQKKTASLADTTYTTAQIVIKKEKISNISADSSSSIASSIHSETSVIKNGIVKDAISDMPAPSKVPPRKKKIKAEPLETTTRSTRTRTKPKQYYESPEKSSRGKPSDVIVQNTTVTMIDLSEDKDPDTERKTKDDQQSTRTTRTKTRQKKHLEVEQPKKEVESKIETKHSKRIRSKSSSEDVVENVKKSKSTSSHDQEVNETGQTDYEDAVSNLCPADIENIDIQNATMVINSTMVVENPKKNKTTKVQGEPEAKKPDWKTPPKTKSKKQQIKEIFSPYENKSLKKKVEAFEKFGSASKESANPSKIPLLKEHGTSGDPGSALKSKPYTPFSNKFIPKTCSTVDVNKNHPRSQKKSSLYNDSGTSMRCLSALKASQAELREREKRRQEKEAEGQLKKDALLQAQAEEIKRKREEKQLKAQQQRELLEKEREKNLELQRLKDEKHKQTVTEKEEKIQKTKEEVEKKRLLAKNKAKILREKERLAAQKQDNGLPIYMTTKANLLPTEDCYDSDDDEYEFHRKNYTKPNWSRDNAMYKQLYTQLIAGEKIKNTLFCCTNHNVDLVEIFENIDPRKLKRTSSAQWRKPPRYTLFSETSEIHFSEDSDDEKDVKGTPRTKR